MHTDAVTDACATLPEGINKTVVRQANWQKVGGASPLWRKSNQLRHSVSRAQVPVRVQAKRR